MVGPVKNVKVLLEKPLRKNDPLKSFKKKYNI
jgi:hypothetical protein